MPKVSIIIPTHNRPQYLKNAILSITKQTFKDFEIIVVNDGGVNVDNIINSFKDFPIIYHSYNEKKGPAYARNAGIALSNGKYIGYLDDDDQFYPWHLESLVSFMETNKYKFVYSDAEFIYQLKLFKCIPLTISTKRAYYDFDPIQIMIDNYIPTLTILHERDCLKKTGIFDETMLADEDWDLWLRMSQLYKFGHLNRITCWVNWRLDGSSITSSDRTNYLKNKIKIYQKYKQEAMKYPEVQQGQLKNVTEIYNSLKCYEPLLTELGCSQNKYSNNLVMDGLENKVNNILNHLHLLRDYSLLNNRLGKLPVNILYDMACGFEKINIYQSAKQFSNQCIRNILHCEKIHLRHLMMMFLKYNFVSMYNIARYFKIYFKRTRSPIE